MDINCTCIPSSAQIYLSLSPTLKRNPLHIFAFVLNLVCPNWREVIEFLWIVKTSPEFDFYRILVHIPHGDFTLDWKALAVSSDEVKKIQRQMKGCDASGDGASIIVTTWESFGFRGGDLVSLSNAKYEINSTEDMMVDKYSNIQYRMLEWLLRVLLVVWCCHGLACTHSSMPSFVQIKRKWPKGGIWLIWDVECENEETPQVTFT